MAWRFKASKYKNAAPLEPKLDLHIRDLSIGSYHSCGNFIAASAAFLAFNWDSLGSSLAVLPLATKGRPDKATVPRIDGHSSLVTDFAFSPHDDGLLATGSQDQTVKIWRIPRTGLSSNLTVPEVSLGEQARRVETVSWHPTAEALLASSSGQGIALWDLSVGRQAWTYNGHADQVQAVAWQWEGGLLATQAKDRTLRILDPRTDVATSETRSHDGIKDSKVVWVGEHRVLTTGFGADRCRQLILRDTRKLSSPEHLLSLDVSSGILVPLFDPDTNMVFLSGKGDRYIQFVEIADKDPWFVEGLRYTGEQIKGACLVPKRALNVMTGEVNRVLQLANSSIIPITWQVPRKSYREYHGDIYPDTASPEPVLGPQDWLQGATTRPAKYSLNPTCRPADPTRFGPLLSEVVRVGRGNKNTTNNQQQQATDPGSPKPAPRPRVARSQSDAAPGPLAAPRPSPRPTSTSSVMPPPTRPKPAMVASRSVEEEEDQEDQPDCLRRQPSIRDRMKMFEKKEEERKSWGEKKEGAKEEKGARHERKMDTIYCEEDKENAPMEIEPENNMLGHQNLDQNCDAPLKPTMLQDASEPFLMAQTRPQQPSLVDSSNSNNRLSKFGRVTKFRHMKGTPMPKSMHFENLKNLSKSVSADCDFIQANPDRLVVPLAGPGGKLAVFEMAKSGRIPDGVTPAVINTATVMDFAWDPFNNRRLAVAMDDGAINLWEIPEDGLDCQVNDPMVRIQAHAGEKVNVIKFHPTAADIVATAGFDWMVRIWHLAGNRKEALVLEGHTDQVYSLAWSQCGSFLATVCRDGRVRVYSPRTSPLPLLEGGDVVPKKGARVVWAMDGRYLVVTGFSRQSERQVTLYASKDLSLLHTETMDVSPSILVPHYDEDSSTLFLSGKGETTVYGFEVAQDSPHMFLLSPYKCSSPCQGLAFIQHKNALNVRDVEFARGYRLTTNYIEPISFTVPRVKSTFFQDDLFPPTRVLWQASCSGARWLAGELGAALWVSLRPHDMPALSNGMSSTKPAAIKKASTTTTVTSSGLNREEADNMGKGLKDSVSRILGTTHSLEQDCMEGVEDKDWEEEE